MGNGGRYVTETRLRQLSHDVREANGRKKATKRDGERDGEWGMGNEDGNTVDTAKEALPLKVIQMVHFHD